MKNKRKKKKKRKNILREAGITLSLFVDDLKMYARITNRIDITVMQNAF